MSLARFSVIVQAGRDGLIAKKQTSVVGGQGSFGAIRSVMVKPFESDFVDKYWAETTQNSAIGTVPKEKGIVICGRGTYENFPGNLGFKTLKNRNIVVVSSTMKQQDHNDCWVVPSFRVALERVATYKTRGRVWVVGGCELFREALESWWYLCDEIRFIRFRESYNPTQEDIVFPIPFSTLATSYVLFQEPRSTNKFDCYRFSPVLTWKENPVGIFELDLTTGKSFGSKESGEVRVAGSSTRTFMKCPDDCYLLNREFHDLHPEYGYLNLLATLLRVNNVRPNRTNVDTLSMFAPPALKFRLYESNPTSARFGQTILPLLTTKKMPYKTILRELLWFISGDTNSKTLEKDGVKIWRGNTSEDFLFKLANSGHTFFERVSEGEGGSLYGHQWRRFGALHELSEEMEEISSSENAAEITKYIPEGVDQISELVNSLRENPFSRRHILLGWNPIDIYERKCVALPACHILAQFYVRREGVDEESRFMKDYSSPNARSDADIASSSTSASITIRGGLKLDCHLYMRSSDAFLGLPFNIASYAYLDIMLAHVVGIEPGTLTVSFGDAHLYTDHIEQAKIQLKRTPRPFPTIKIRNPRGHKCLEDFGVNSFIIDDSYEEVCCAPIRGEMVA